MVAARGALAAWRAEGTSNPNPNPNLNPNPNPNPNPNRNPNPNPDPNANPYPNPCSSPRRTESRLQLPACYGASERGVPWVTYPGLFAGGGLDVMTAALLRALPTPPVKGAILDACCGSGVIAAALRARAGAQLDIHLLDADAVALDAARANVPTAARVFLCDGWPDTASAFPKKGKPKKYEWIVSNPPVHHGQPDDF